jgi:hypothetical protein
MYSALRNAQTEMNNVLLKFGEDVNHSLSLRSSQVPAASDPQTVDQDARNAIDSLNESMDAKFSSLMSMVERLNGTMSKIVILLENQAAPKKGEVTVSMEQNIPNLQPISNPLDLGSFTLKVSKLPKVEEQKVEAKVVEVEEEVEEEEEVEVEEEVEEEEVVEEVEEVEVEEEVEEEEAVEEWTYKGRSYFKSTDHKVYAVDSDGDPGELLGIYDPVKNLVRKA